MSRSRPANAAASISSVDSGMWKFVISLSVILKSYGGKMNLSVHPRFDFRWPSVVTLDSTARQVLVPTTKTFPLLSMVLLTTCDRALGDFVVLRVHLVFGEVFHLDRPEGAEPDVQHDGDDLDPLAFQGASADAS